MKNVLISIVLGVFLASCAKSKYADLDSQFAQGDNHVISAKYNNKNCVVAEKRKKALVRQIALSTKQ